MSTQIALRFSCVSRISYAMLQNKIRILREVEVGNNSKDTISGGILSLCSSPSFFAPCEFYLPDIKAGENYRLKDFDIHFDHGYFSRMTEAERGTLHIRLQKDGEDLASEVYEIEMLARSQWGGLSEFPELVASFVQPNDPSVDKLLGQAQELMKWAGVDSAIIGYERDKTAVWRQVSAIWRALLTFKLGYALPPASFETTGQKLRTPTQILDAKLGTCIDTSLLFAACLEQANLNPLIIFTKGHAFAGCWLSPSTFSTALTDDVTALRKRIDLREILVFETTLLTRHDVNFSFKEACDYGSNNLRENASDEFICVIDVARARMQGIKPLPSANHPQFAIEEVPDLETPVTIIEEEPEDLDRSIPQQSVETDAPLTKLELWQRKLLDLSLRNSLLNYRTNTSKRYVEFMIPDPCMLEDRLSDGERFTLLSGPEMIKGDQRAVEGTMATRTAMMEDLANKLFHKEKLLSSLEKKEMDSRLLTLYRASKNALEEGGANTLYLAYGFLTWAPENQSNKQCKAPLILIPARLERKNARSEFKLSIGEDEPRFNMTLLEMLRRDFALTALDSLGKELPHDEHGLDIDGIWRMVQNAIRDIRGWEVSHAIGLGLFSFAKYLMWNDIVANIDILKQSSIVNHLMSPGKTFAGEPDFLSPDELDEKLPPNEVYCPLLADSSQLSAIASAAAGKTFVLEGPPGTGKSQTIANMITHCLAHGKTVLFVAEKAAALNVVHQRLKNIGLGEFCLELHSNKAKKSDVIAQLGQAASCRKVSEDDWIRKTAQLSRTRTELNDYVHQLHKRYPNGLTAYQAMGTIVHSRSCPELSLAWPSVRTHDRNSYDELFNIARRITSLGHDGSALSLTALKYIGQKEWSPSWQSQELLPALKQLRSCGEELNARASVAQDIIGLPFMEACGEVVESLHRLVQLLPQLVVRPWTFILRPDASNLLPQFKQASALLAEYDELWSSLSIAYTPQAVSDDLVTLREAWMQAGLAWWPKSVFLRRKVAGALKALATGAGTPDCATDLPKLQTLYGLRQKMERYEHLSEIAPDVFVGIETNPQEITELLEFADNLYSTLQTLSSDEQGMIAISDALIQLASPSSSVLAEGGRGIAAMQAWDAAARKFESALADVMLCLQSQENLKTLAPSEIIRICAELENKSSRIHSWCAWLRLCHEAKEHGLTPLIDAVTNGTLKPMDVENSLRVNYARWWICGVIDELPALRTFVLQDHERRIADFKELDETIRQMTTDCIAGVLRSTPLTSCPAEQWQILQKEVTKKKRHMSVRKLLENIPDLLPLLTPCLLMSPLSVAQYLSAGQMKFDIVIFDEASQIPVWDAVGALARGDKAIVVGDTKQLPPTNFFQKGDDADTDDDGLVGEDLESILEECIGSGMPRLPLRWHYRSRHESLICFSNHQYYNGNLVTFPAPDTHDEAVSFCYVEGGVYERGTSRTNPTEARAVVDNVVHTLKDPAFQQSGKSIGIVTFNVQQQNLIEDLLDAARRADPSLEYFFGAEVEEPVFVKNIENIQGDERDIMYFSICFAPDLAGKFTMNFGALNRDGGERRLNVAITRARYELRIFSSIEPNQIQTNSTRAKGVHDLRLFLEFAQNGIQALAAEIQGRGEDYESPFEQAVAEELQKLGWEIHPQVGVSGFRIDLGVVDPDVPGDYLAGVECDGYTYHRSATARDRDRLRENVLNGLGWDIVRIWSTEWWLNQQDATRKLHDRLNALLEERRIKRNSPSTSQESEKIQVSLEKPSKTELVAEESASAPKAAHNEGLGEAMQQEHTYEIVRETIAKFSPIHEDELCTLASRKMGFHKVGSKIRQQVLNAAYSNYQYTTEEVGVFFWKEGQSPENCKFRKRDSDETCDVKHIAMPELIALARTVRASSEDPAVDMARKLGLSRLRASTRPRLEEAWRLSKEIR